jgi:hypothetical protein
MEHYAVVAQFGHVGRGKYIPKTIPVYAENGREAAEKVRWMPRVKHHRKDAIIDVKKISEEEYLELKEINKNDPYFKVGSKQEQEKLCINIEETIISYEEPHKVKKTDRDDTVKYKMKKNKIIYSEALYSMRNYEAALAY